MSAWLRGWCWRPCCGDIVGVEPMAQLVPLELGTGGYGIEFWRFQGCTRLSRLGAGRAAKGVWA